MGCLSDSAAVVAVLGRSLGDFVLDVAVVSRVVVVAVDSIASRGARVCGGELAEGFTEDLRFEVVESDFSFFFMFLESVVESVFDWSLAVIL